MNLHYAYNMKCAERFCAISLSGKVAQLELEL